jgi:hypothetical protein
VKEILKKGDFTREELVQEVQQIVRRFLSDQKAVGG